MRLVYKGNYIRMTCGEIGLVQDVYFSLHTVGIPPELFQIKSDVSSLYYIPQAQNIKKNIVILEQIMIHVTVQYGKTSKFRTPHCSKYSVIQNKFRTRCIQIIGPIYELF